MSNCAIGFITCPNGRLLFGQRHDGTWAVPGGHLEGNEGSKEGFVREAHEEAGLDLQPTDLTLFHQQPLHGENEGGVLYCFSAAWHGDTSVKNDPDGEFKRLEWIDVSQGIPSNIFDNLAHGSGPSNILTQVFDKAGLQKSERIWLDAGFAQPLIKMHLPPTFPKLGIENRRETPIVQTDSELNMRGKLLAHAIHHDPESQSWAREATPNDWKQFAHGVAATTKGSVNGWSLANPMRDAGQNQGHGDLATKHHEDFHQMMIRVENKHGEHARRNLAANLYHAIPRESRDHLDDLEHTTGGTTHGHPMYHEEALASMLNFVNDPEDRKRFHDLAGHSARRASEADDHIKKAYRVVRGAAHQADESWLGAGLNKTEHPDVPGVSNLWGHARKHVQSLKLEPDDHVQAAELHSKAADEHRAKGETRKAYWRRALAHAHREASKVEPLQKSIADIKPGLPVHIRSKIDREDDNGVFDYSHVLPTEHQQSGHRLHVKVKKNPGGGAKLYSEISSPGKPDDVIGDVSGVVNQHGLHIGGSFLNNNLRGKGVGKALYQALYAHAYHSHGVRNTSGDIHSTSASKVHQALSSDYQPQIRPGNENESDRDYDGRFAPYSYQIKSGLLEKSEINDLLRHPNPLERSMALKLDGVTSDHLALGLLDPDEWVFQQAFHHPDAPLNVLAAHTRDAAGNPIFDRHVQLTLDPRITPEHLDTLYGAVRDDAAIPESTRIQHLTILAKHPKFPVSKNGLSAMQMGLPIPEFMAKAEWAHKLIADQPAPQADHTQETPMPHLQHLAQAFHQNVGSSQAIKPENADLHQQGYSVKVIYKMPHEGGHHRMMIKPYSDQTKPNSGWAELTSQALYHAGGIGHLHQEVFPVQHGIGEHQAPAIGIKLEDANPVDHKNSMENDTDGRKVALMDYLSGNHDRKIHNYLKKPDGKLLAIDHGEAFPIKSRFSAADFPSFKNVISEDGHTQVFGHPRGQDEPLHHSQWKNAFKWWSENGSKIKATFHDRVNIIKDHDAKTSVLNNFNNRAAWLDRRSKDVHSNPNWFNIPGDK